MKQYLTKLILGLMGLVLSVSTLQAQAYQEPSSEAPKHEFRSIWVATALGLDWPKTTDVEQQRATLLAIIERHVEMRMNAVVFQVTSRGNALYYSERLPWAWRMTGTMGQDPGWDPLQFIIDESKKRGLEVHAWYNVFNVGTRGQGDSEYNQYMSTTEPEHVIKSNPDWVKEVSGGFWLNPGIPEARQWSVENVLEIVENYDVDAVHFDFARYPAAFSDDTSTRNTHDPDFVGAMDAWRRNNVNEFQRDAFAAIQEIKPWVKVGTSPFGHYQRSSYNSPPSEPCPAAYNGRCSWAAALAYSQVYQDAVAWINEGVNDYIAPQIYWNIGPGGVSTSTNPHFEFLTRDWRRLSIDSGKHVYIGIGAYQNSVANNVAAELGVEVDTIRANNHAGHMFFRYDNIYGPTGPPRFQNAPKIDYGTLAFVPAMDWKDIDVPPAVDIARESPVASIMDDGNDITLTWDAPAFETASGDTKISYAVYRVNDNSVPDAMTAMEDPANLYAFTGETTFTDRITEAGQYYYFVTAYSRNWVEGEPSNVVEHFTATSVESGDEIASAFKLDQNYPNPFNPTTQIQYAIGESVHTNLTVYDALGRQVATLVNETMPAGNHSVMLNAENLSSGVYIYILRAGDVMLTQKMMLVK
jgi:uncharacterized lipoprotein YddW (UPF0748 family)